MRCSESLVRWHLAERSIQYMLQEASDNRWQCLNTSRTKSVLLFAPEHKSRLCSILLPSFGASPAPQPVAWPEFSNCNNAAAPTNNKIDREADETQTPRIPIDIFSKVATAMVNITTTIAITMMEGWCLTREMMITMLPP